MNSALIALDWGTTSFRGYHIGADATVLEKVSAKAGIMQVGSSSFEDVLVKEIGHWLREFPQVPIVASGMITSKQGWVETPYLPCPATLADLARNLQPHELRDGRLINFVCGVCQEQPTPNIMRGEETQVAGLVSDEPLTMILPGTHSKWIQCKEGAITGFSTFMTGELYAALTQHTILGRLMTDASDPQAFDRGVEDGFTTEGTILSKMFGARAMPLLDLMGADGVGDYLSGLLIGAEIKEGAGSAYSKEHPPRVSGEDALTARYMRAFELCNIVARHEHEDLAAAGLYRIAKEAGLILST